MKITNTTTRERFHAHIDWAEEQIASIPTRFSGTEAWKIHDRFGNEWVVTFTGDKVYLYLSGDSFEIMRAVEGKRHIQSDRLLGKYKYLALMVSNYFRFHLLRIA
ncbi:hypothetical protein D3Z52_02390 [Clostridiaceae bacterium]|nr:hypothetical protein [Clostridiaceae bacterium]